MYRQTRRTALLAVTALAAGLLGATADGFASSHREAPQITQTPKLDGTDFYLFRSYEQGRSAFVTMIANYLPLQDIYGGPNYFNLDPNAVYDINIDNQGTAQPALTFRFRFSVATKGLALDVGGKQVPIALTELGPVGQGAPPATQNVVETYTLSLVTYANGQATETPVTNAANGSKTFGRPLDEIGGKTIPNYDAYAKSFIYSINIPGCPTPGRVFAGQRKEGFVISLAETFDLLNYRHPVGEQFAHAAKNDLDDKNVTSLIVEAPIACLRTANDPVIGAWTTSATVARNGAGLPALRQVSRLANPLVNELVIGLPDKDKFNASQPINDPQFLQYVTNPTFPAILETLFGFKAPTAFPRSDLVAVFLTGLAGLNQPANLRAPGELMRLNTDIAPTAYGQQKRLGVIGGDAAGYPNGRRPGDDVVDISLRVVMGKLYTGTTAIFGKPSDAPAGEVEFTDGAYVDSTYFDSAFPYLKNPNNGSPQP